jgi:hypothetical protein
MRAALPVAIALMVALAGCSTSMVGMQVQKAERNAGKSQTYAVDYERAWDISRAILHWAGGDTIEEHRSEGYMLSATGMSGFTSGTLMGVWLEKCEPDQVKVTVVTRKKWTVELGMDLTEDEFHTQFAMTLDIVSRGEPIPLRAPSPEPEHFPSVRGR